MNQTFTVKYLNNDGGGFAESCPLEPGTTVARFLEQRQIGAAHYKIRLRRREEDGTVSSQTPTADTELKEGDFLSCVPLKAEGAAAAQRAPAR